MEDTAAFDIFALVSDPVIQVTLDRLRGLSALLHIDLQCILKFLEDFSDIYLSLAYYKQCMDEISLMIDDYRRDLDALRTNWQLSKDHRFVSVCEATDKTLVRFESSIQRRFDTFYENTETMWENMSAAKFRKIESVIKAHHTAIGGLLCGVGSKLRAWRGIFPDGNSGGPVARADALMPHIVPGMERITFPLKIIEALDFTFDVELV